MTNLTRRSLIGAAAGAGADRQRVRRRRHLQMGSLMAGALVGSLPLVILSSFFVECYVSAMTGAVKE